MKSISLTVLVLLFMLPSHAHMFSTGTYVPYFNKVQTSNSGATKKFEINPYLGLSTELQMTPTQYFLPEFGYSYYMENAKGSRREMIFLHYNFGYVASPNLLVRYGLTTHRYRIIGKGGTTTLKNGNDTKAFLNPDETVTSYFTTLNIGAEYFFQNRTRGLRFDLNTMSFSKFENKAFNYLLTYNFYFQYL